jgi:hypothetical protein
LGEPERLGGPSFFGCGQAGPPDVALAGAVPRVRGVLSFSLAGPRLIRPATANSRNRREAQAPFGSIYHFFPGGKQQLAETAVRTSGAGYRRMVLALLGRWIPDPEAPRRLARSMMTAALGLMELPRRRSASGSCRTGSQPLR